jgi:hypothetical protein
MNGPKKGLLKQPPLKLTSIKIKIGLLKRNNDCGFAIWLKRL